MRSGREEAHFWLCCEPRSESRAVGMCERYNIRQAFSPPADLKMPAPGLRFASPRAGISQAVGPLRYGAFALRGRDVPAPGCHGCARGTPTF
ncbi:hypothetical protein SBV1_430002 [Verrucomicrobia bacterium]|nr:hypothetical protein SBV1_430002 [Verrucomicrobiota bacterium]